MKALLEFLDATGWSSSPGVRSAVKGGWIYHWHLETAVFPHPLLIRRPYGERPNIDAIEAFVIRDEERCLEVAANLNHGEHPPAPIFNRVHGRKIGYL